MLPHREHLIPHPEGAHFIVINFSQAFLRADLDVDPLDLEDVPAHRFPELTPFRFQEHLDFILTGDTYEARRLALCMLDTDRVRTFGSTTLLRGYLLQLIGSHAVRGCARQARAAAPSARAGATRSRACCATCAPT